MSPSQGAHMTAITYNDLLSAYERYPAPIRPYLLRAQTHPALILTLTKSFMRVLIDLLARAPIAEPSRPIKLRVDIVAAELCLSTKTVTRTLNVLRKRAWLFRLEGHDGRNNWGEFCAGEFILGDALRALIGLPTTNDRSSTSCITKGVEPVINVVNRITGTTPSGIKSKDSEAFKESAVQLTVTSATVQADAHNVDFDGNETEMSDGLYRVNKVFKKEASFLKDGNPTPSACSTGIPRIPSDLRSLQTELGISPAGICKLMQLAKCANQRLQDVWIAKRDQLLNAQVRDGRAFKYLQFLLGCGEDFSYIARQKCIGKSIPIDHCSTAARSKKASEPNDVRRYWNKKYVGSQGVKVRVHGDGSAEISDARRTDAYIRPADMISIYEAIEAGKLWLLEE